MSEFIGVIQEIVQNTIKAMKLTDKATGTVVSVNPLSVQVDMSMQNIPASALKMTDAVRAKTASIQGGSGGTVTINEGLKAGDRVLMLRVQHGQEYIILSKIV